MPDIETTCSGGKILAKWTRSALVSVEYVDGAIGERKEATFYLLPVVLARAQRNTWMGAVIAWNVFRGCLSSCRKRIQEHWSSVAVSVRARVKSSYGCACLQRWNTKNSSSCFSKKTGPGDFCSLKEYCFFEGFGSAILSKNVNYCRSIKNSNFEAMRKSKNGS